MGPPLVEKGSGERENNLKEGTTLDWVEVGGRRQGQRQISVANLIMIIITTTITTTIIHMIYIITIMIMSAVQTECSR